jgi:ATP-binding cassette subfamily G (WHITE) protein 2 (SNQ2)
MTLADKRTVRKGRCAVLDSAGQRAARSRRVVNSFKGRTILAKHKAMALYRPSALIFAQVMVDIPLVALQVTMFLVPIYFMSGLRRTAGAFFTLWIVTYVTTHSLLGFFRMIGFSFSSFQGAGAVSGLALGLIILTMGYLLPNAQLPWW